MNRAPTPSERLRAEHAELMAQTPRGSDVYGAREARLAAIRRELDAIDQAERAAADAILGAGGPRQVSGRPLGFRDSRPAGRTDNDGKPRDVYSDAELEL